MVYPIMRQRNYQSYPANNMLQKQSSNIAPSRNNIQSKVQPLVTKGVGGLSKTLNNVQQVLKDRKSTRLNSSHVAISYAVFCLKKKKKQIEREKTQENGQRQKEYYH